MFLYFLVYLATSPTDQEKFDISEDLTVKENVYLEIPYNLKTKNTQVENYIKKNIEGINDDRREKLIMIASFYSSEIKKSTNEKYHNFLEYFTTLICYFVYNNDEIENTHKFKPELLFNLICFGKFMEIYKTDEKVKEIVEQMSGDLVAEKNPGLSAERYKDIMTSYENRNEAISDSFSQEDKSDLALLQGLKITPCVNNETFKNMSKLLSNATFQCFLGFFLVLKCKNFSENLEHYEKKNSVYSNISTNFTESFINETKIEARKLEDELGCGLNIYEFYDVWKIFLGPILDRILEKGYIFGLMFNFPKYLVFYQNYHIDSSFPQVFIELFYKESELNKINGLYIFMKEQIKKDYQKYFSAVICLKVTCLKGGIFESNLIKEIIFEFLFLADVLKTELEKVENIEKIKKNRSSFVDTFKKILDQKKIEYVKGGDSDFLDCSKLPKTEILLEIFGYIDLFSNDCFKGLLNTKIHEKLKKEQKSMNEDEDVDKREKDYLINVFEQEIFALSPEELKFIFYTPVIETKKSKTNSDLKTIIFWIVFSIIIVSVIFIVGYWYFYRKG
ncbi:hypothetical protein CWI39_0171p0020 [Hamiltosporidium magnivora]|uniref:Uncharacterized protein n=1 Tax=Hamiltosporidium magnivora TaxID=148818 RepID=A0A4Q9LKV3_9MICR|nr:hypothetical protein CWI39_0171p0020 [Hamiltosporidium magnivora]